jgi:hypothetical protein
LYASFQLAGQARPSYTLPSRNENGEIPPEREKKERRPPVGCHTHQHVVDFAVILGGANHALAQSALSFFHLVGVIVLLRATHACYRITLEFF